MNKTEIRVRYAETDQMGIAYYANYFVWMEVARTDYLRTLGYSYSELEKTTGVRLAVLDAQCKYRSPAYYDETLEIQTQVYDLKRLKIFFRYRIVSGDRLVAEGETTIASLDANGKPFALPPHIYDAISKIVVKSEKGPTHVS